MQVARALADYLAPILNDCCADAARVAVALSGGADSMALTLLARDWGAARHIPFVTFTVDHGLRPGSAQEAQQVNQWMQALGISHRILTPQANPSIRNPQERARVMRYRALIDACHATGATHLLLAHHYDDQAETVALQQHRGARGPSRAGMALGRKQDGIVLLRPLLGVRKAALVSYLRALDQPWVEDPSNESDAYARNRLRKEATESQQRAWWEMARQGGHVRQDDEAARNQWFIQHAQALADGYTLSLDDWRTARIELQQDLLSHAIRCVGGKQHRPRLHETQRLAARLLAEPDGVATLGHCAVRWREGVLTIRPQATLEASPHAAYIASANAPNPLVSEPFWWFNYPPFNDGAHGVPA